MTLDFDQEIDKI